MSKKKLKNLSRCRLQTGQIHSLIDFFSDTGPRMEILKFLF